MWHWLGAVIFLSTLGFIIILLIIAYTCIKHEMCWCQKHTKARSDSTDEPLLDSIYVNKDRHPIDDTDDDGDDGDNRTGVSPSFNKVLVSEQCGVGEFNYILTHPSTHHNKPSPYMSVNAQRNSDAVLSKLPTSSCMSANSSVTYSVESPLTSDGELDRPDAATTTKKKKRVTLANLSDNNQSSDFGSDDARLSSSYFRPSSSGKRTTDSSQTDSEFGTNVGTKIGKKKKTEAFIDGIHLKISLVYSKTDGTLMLTLNEITGVPLKSDGGYTHVRVSTALLPEKKYRTKTVWHLVTDDDIVVFGDSFKFSQLGRHILLSSAFRFRLYGRRGTSRDLCVGEIFVQVSEAMQRQAGFVTWKKFQRRNSSE